MVQAASRNAEVAAALDAVVRQEWGRLVAALIGTLRDFQLAEDSLQDAVESAVGHWSRNGLPRAPAAWLLQTARRKAIDRLRRVAYFRRKEAEIAALMALDHETAFEPEDMVLPDERLSLIFTCCHPALDEKSRVALTLRTVAGLTTPEIARAFLDTETTMAQRLVRAQGKIRDAGIPYRIPDSDDLPARAPAVLDVIYLIFNEGHAASRGADLVRLSLCEEAVRLARLVAAIKPPIPEAHGLLALLLLNAARMPARSGAGFVPLDRQDRDLWDRARIAEGRSIVRATLNRMTAGPFLIQAAISALHCEAKDEAATDWAQIAALYGELLRRSDTPVVRLNRLVALSFSSEPATALREMAGLAADLEGYQPFHAARADMLRRCNRFDEARSAYRCAIALTRNEQEKAFLTERLASI